jgi:hypothetical protein
MRGIACPVEFQADSAVLPEEMARSRVHVEVLTEQIGFIRLLEVRGLRPRIARVWTNGVGLDVSIDKQEIGRGIA